jgi:hypothetical protein
VTGEHAFVVRVAGRYFYGFNKRGHIMTAWSLPGAKLFSDAREAIAVERLAKMRGRESRTEIVAPLLMEVHT